MLALPNLEMTGKQVFGILGILALIFTVIFMIFLFLEKRSSYIRSFGFAALVLWLSSLVLAAVEVNTSFQAMLATISILNRGNTALDLTAQLTPMLGLWFYLIGFSFLIATVIVCPRNK